MNFGRKKMQIRKRFLPRTMSDASCLGLCLVFIPVTLIFELLVVLPQFHSITGVFYGFATLAGLFIVFNIVFNLLACILIDTSIKTELLVVPSNPASLRQWHYCVDCEIVVPPRSWHCATCKTCILKRDHHCMFTGCCIGHRNYRYFLMFLVYMMIGSACSTVYSSIYLWVLNAHIYVTWKSLIKMVLPLFMFTLDLSLNNFYLLIYGLNIIAVSYSAIMLAYHLPNIWIGAVANEKSHRKYDLGWRQNIEMVLGKRMHLVWISPFVNSDLPHDGIHWESIEKHAPKNR